MIYVIHSMLQEHWLLESQLCTISEFHKDFDGIAYSVMTNRSQKGLIVGRPHGGLGLLFRKSFEYSHKVCGFV